MLSSMPEATGEPRYRVHCPKCRHEMTSPFVRIGAAVRCVGCGEVFRIEEGHVQRRAVAGGAAESSARGSAKSAPRQGSAMDDSSIGLSGLSSIMAGEGAATRSATASVKSTSASGRSAGGSGASGRRGDADPAGGRSAGGSRGLGLAGGPWLYVTVVTLLAMLIVAMVVASM